MVTVRSATGKFGVQHASQQRCLRVDATDQQVAADQQRYGAPEHRDHVQIADPATSMGGATASRILRDGGRGWWMVVADGEQMQSGEDDDDCRGIMLRDFFSTIEYCILKYVRVHTNAIISA